MSAPHDSARAGDRQLSMLWSGFALVSGKGVAMLLGFAYWVLAANLYPERTVGIVGAAIAGIMLIGQLAIVGVESAVVLTYPRYEASRSRLFNTAFTLVGAVSLGVSLAMLTVMGLLGNNLAEIVQDPVVATLFVLMGTFAGIVTVQDQVSMAIKRGDHVIPRNTLNGLLSIVPLAVMFVISGSGSGGAGALLGAWVGGGLAGVLLGVRQLAARSTPYRFRPEIDRRIAKELVRIGLPNHVLTLAERVPVFVTPLIITQVISPEANAHWYVVWMAAWVTLVVARSMAHALLAEAAQDPNGLRHHVGRAIRGMLGLGALGAAATILLAPLLLRLMGNSYEAAGTVPLRLLVLSFAPYAVVMAYFSTCRATNRLKEANIIGVAMSVALLGAASVAAIHGLTWIAASWVIVMAVFGIVAGYRLNRVVSAESAIPVGAS